MSAFVLVSAIYNSSVQAVKKGLEPCRTTLELVFRNDFRWDLYSPLIQLAKRSKGFMDHARILSGKGFSVTATKKEWTRVSHAK